MSNLTYCRRCGQPKLGDEMSTVMMCKSCAEVINKAWDAKPIPNTKTYYFNPIPKKKEEVLN